MRWCWTPTRTPRCAETRDHGYPILEQLNRLVPDGIVWAPALSGGYLLTTRGGDFELTIGQDISIGYLRHTDDDRRPVPAGDVHLRAVHQRGIGVSEPVATATVRIVVTAATLDPRRAAETSCAAGAGEPAAAWHVGGTAAVRRVICCDNLSP